MGRNEKQYKVWLVAHSVESRAVRDAYLNRARLGLNDVGGAG